MQVRFDHFEFDQERFELRHDGELVALEPQVFDVLAFLISHRNRVVSKEELLDGVWGDRFVSESALTSRIKAVRQALGDDGTAQRFVQTIRGRGYRFIASTSSLDRDANGNGNTSDNGVDGSAPVSAPSGVVTFLFTDIEGSTQLWAADRTGMAASLLVHDTILRQETEARGGFVFTQAGDSFAIAFSRASDAIEAVLVTQETLHATVWPGPILKVRMGLHLGEAEERGNDYFGPVVNLTARLESAGHGGQVLLTDQVRRAAGIEAVDLGWHHLRDVPEQVQVFQLGEDTFPALRIPTVGRTNLPTPASRLIGRDEVLAEVRLALTQHRLVTLTAAGGIGKTRLALAIGESELTKRRDGVWFIDLTTISDGSQLPEAIAAGIGLVLTSGDRTAQVVDYLAGLDALLIVDNCEHLVDACADFAEVFLSRPGESQIVATTREFFDVDGERAIRLPSLEVAGGQSAAAKLFMERASMADSTFTVDDDELTTVAELCRHLDGSPLAIELAAARSNVMSPAELLEGLSARFELLRGGRRRSKQSLEDTLTWSYELLDDDEQAMFRNLGVFVGSFDLDAVVSISRHSRAAALDLMDSLIAKSLVVSRHEAKVVRFHLLETTAAYAERTLEEAGETQGASERHLDHYLSVCAPYDVGFWASWLPESVAADRDNIRAAISWAARSSRWEDAGRLVYSASTVLQTHPEDLVSITSDCLEHLSGVDPVRTLGLWFVTIYTSIQYDLPEAQSTVLALEASKDQYELGMRALWLTFFDFHSKGAEVALSSYADAIAQFANIPDGVLKSQLLAGVEVIAGWANANLGRHDQSLNNHTASQQYLAAEAPETTLIAEALASEGIAYVLLGNPTPALGIADRLDERHYLYFSGEEVRAAALLALGDLDAAPRVIREHAADAVTGRLSRKANNSLLFLALLAEAEHDNERAARLLMGVENARNPAIALSFELANRLDVREPFEAARLAGIVDQKGSGRRAIELLKTEMARRGWADGPTLQPISREAGT